MNTKQAYTKMYRIFKKMSQNEQERLRAERSQVIVSYDYGEFEIEWVWKGHTGSANLHGWQKQYYFKIPKTR